MSAGDKAAQPQLSDAWRDVLSKFDKAAKALLKTSKPLTVHETTVMIAVPNEFTRERIESKLRREIEEALSDIYQHSMRLAITIEPDLELDLREPEREAEEEVAPAEFVPKQPAKPETPVVDTQIGPRLTLNPKFTFDNFVIGESNRFAHAGAIAAAEAPGQAYNPLLIYGESGLGKTHLLHAIGHYVQNYFDKVVVKYVSSEEMTNDFINAISENRTNEFRRAYREVDVLLIDDVQFLQSKIQTQEEFFHTFNTLQNAQKQIVMTCDRPPKELEALEPRLRSRFEMGLIVDIQPPDLETRIAILRRKAQNERLKVDAEVLEFIASRIQTNIRELEGALIRVTAFASLNQEPVDLKLAESVLKDLVTADTELTISADQILAHTADYFGIEIDDITGKSRNQTLVSARQIAMYLCRELTDLSLPKIGEEFGGKDHTTVMHACKKISNLMSEKRSVYNQVTELTNKIKQNGS